MFSRGTGGHTDTSRTQTAATVRDALSTSEWKGKQRSTEETLRMWSKQQATPRLRKVVQTSGLRLEEYALHSGNFEAVTKTSAYIGCQKWKSRWPNRGGYRVVVFGIP